MAMTVSLFITEPPPVKNIVKDSSEKKKEDPTYAGPVFTVQVNLFLQDYQDLHLKAAG